MFTSFWIIFLWNSTDGKCGWNLLSLITEQNIYLWGKKIYNTHFTLFSRVKILLLYQCCWLNQTPVFIFLCISTKTLPALTSCFFVCGKENRLTFHRSRKPVPNQLPKLCLLVHNIIIIQSVRKSPQHQSGLGLIPHNTRSPWACGERRLKWYQNLSLFADRYLQQGYAMLFSQSQGLCVGFRSRICCHFWDSNSIFHGEYCPYWHIPEDEVLGCGLSQKYSQKSRDNPKVVNY